MTPRAQILVLLFGFAAFAMNIGCDAATDVPSDDTGSEVPTDTSPGDSDVDDVIDGPENWQDQACPDYYEAVPIPVEEVFGGSFTAAVHGINSRGWAIVNGTGDLPGRPSSFLWRPDQDNGQEGQSFPIHDEVINDEPFRIVVANALNDAGQVVGAGTLVTDDGFEQRGYAYLWTVGDGAVPFPDDELFGHSVTGINNSGVVVGYGNAYEGEDKYTSGWTWSEGDAELTLMPRLPGAYDWSGSQALDISNRGVVVGSVNDYYKTDHAVKYTPETFYTKLPDFEGSGIAQAAASAINEFGQIAGYVMKYFPAGGFSRWRPVIWEANGTMHDLGILSIDPDLAGGNAVDINDDGLAVGSDQHVGHGRSYAWVWCGGKKRALDAVIDPEDPTDWNFYWVGGINNKGQIAANASGEFGGGVPVILHPVFVAPIGVE